MEIPTVLGLPRSGVLELEAFFNRYMGIDPSKAEPLAKFKEVQDLRTLLEILLRLDGSPWILIRPPSYDGERPLVHMAELLDDGPLKDSILKVYSTLMAYEYDEHYRPSGVVLLDPNRLAEAGQGEGVRRLIGNLDRAVDHLRLWLHTFSSEHVQRPTDQSGDSPDDQHKLAVT